MHKAMGYCRKLRLAGYSDRKLATLAELDGIYDKGADAPGLAGPGKSPALPRHGKGNLFLTGKQSSSRRRNGHRGHPSRYAWPFDFNIGPPRHSDELGVHTAMRARWVRGYGE